SDIDPLLRPLRADARARQFALAPSFAQPKNRFPTGENLFGYRLDSWRLDAQPAPRRTIVRPILRRLRSLAFAGTLLAGPDGHAAEENWAASHPGRGPGSGRARAPD